MSDAPKMADMTWSNLTPQDIASARSLGAETPWTPDQPLRADALYEEVYRRQKRMMLEDGLMEYEARFAVCEEYALACMADARREMAAQLAAVEAERDEARQTLANVQGMLMSSTEDMLASEAQRDRLRQALQKIAAHDKGAHDVAFSPYQTGKSTLALDLVGIASDALKEADHD